MSKQIYYSTEDDLQRCHQFCQLLKKASEITHTLILARCKSQDAENALQYTDSSAIWSVLQDYYHRYFDFINNFSAFTNIKLIPVPDDYYKELSLDCLKKQLYFVIMVTYSYEMYHYSKGTAFKDCFVSLLKDSDLSEYVDGILPFYSTHMRGT